MILAFSAIILAISNTITMFISTLSLSACKKIKGCGFECEMTECHSKKSDSDTEEENDTVEELPPDRPTLTTYDKSPLWHVPKAD